MTLLPKLKKPIRLNDDQARVWKVLGYLPFIGIILLFLFSFNDVSWGHILPPLISVTLLENLKRFLTSFGSSLLIGGAFYGLGMLTGFLFGIPKVIQHPGSFQGSVNGSASQFAHNDNLAQISDWITKIMVGVGLTQLHTIPATMTTMAEYLATGFAGHYNTINIAQNGVIGTVLYFSIAGFLTAYLWTSVYFTNMLSGKPNAGIAGDDVMTTDKNGRRISGKIMETAAGTGNYSLELAVTSTDATNPIKGDVVFHLPQEMGAATITIPAINNAAKLTHDIQKPGIINVTCDSGNTSLTIDLANDITDMPTSFKTLIAQHS